MARYRLDARVQRATIHGGPVLMNFETGNWAALTPEADSFLEQWQSWTHAEQGLTSEQAEFIRVLEQLGFVVKDDERADWLPPDSGDPFIRPRAAYVHVTFVCNLACPFCYSADDRRNKHPDLDTERMQTIFRKLREGQVEDLVISGGEPFVRKDMIELLRYCKHDLGFRHIVVITNGTLLQDVSQLKGIVDQVAVSIDGYDEETNSPIRGKGSFAKAIATVERLKAAGVPHHIISTLHKGNIANARRYIEMGEELDVRVTFSMFTPSGDGAVNRQSLSVESEDLIALGELLAQYPGKASVSETPCSEGLSARERCGIGSHLISVQADGTVYPCHITMLPELAMGNLLLEDLDDIMRTSPIAQQCRELTVENVGFCKSCDYKFFCGGGCRANALYAKNDIKAHDPHCDMNKTFLRLAVTNVLGPPPASGIA